MNCSVRALLVSIERMILTQFLTEGFILDYDADGNIIAIEILEDSTDVPLADLSAMNFEIDCQLMKTGSDG